jgi:galactoside 2-L-fucosyltransferase 1/2
MIMEKGNVTGPCTVFIVIFILLVFSLEGLLYSNQGSDEGDLYFVLPWMQNAPNVSSQRPLITIKHMGRLGNILFEYAALLAVAHITNKTAVLSPPFRSLKKMFHVSLPVCRNLTKLKSMKPFKEVAPQLMRTRERLANLSSETAGIRLEGYFQSYTYFNTVAVKLRKELQFRRNISTTVRNFFKNHTDDGKGTVRVGMHIRRTDMNTPLKIKQGYGTPPVSYFRNAMKYFQKKYKNVIFIICTDDLKWAEKTFKGRNLVFSRNNLPHVDLAILSSCDHVIISNGTFSWWAGWLCKGTTVRYKRYPPIVRVDTATGENQYWPPNGTYNHYITLDY